MSDGVNTDPSRDMLACAGIIVAALALIWGDAAAASPSGVICEVFTIHRDNFSQDCGTRIYRVPCTVYRTLKYCLSCLTV